MDLKNKTTMAPKAIIEDRRMQIDEINRQLIELVSARNYHSLQIGRAKAALGKDLVNPDREAEIFAKVIAMAERKGIDQDFAVSLFALIIDESKRVQRKDEIVQWQSPLARMPQFVSYKGSEIKDDLLAKLVDVARDAFGKHVPEREVIGNTRMKDIVLIAYEAEKIVGFCSGGYAEGTFRFGGTVILAAMQGRGINTEMRKQLIIASNPDFVATFTQNPNVERTLIVIMDSLYQQGHNNGYLITRKLMRGRMGRQLNAVVPVSSDPRINSTYSMLDYNRGDAFELMFEMRK